MNQLILVRHGETEWNVGEIFRGRIDVALNESGLRQAVLLADYLRGNKIDAVYSSPLRRALDTAEVIARAHRLKVDTSPGLTDLDFGRWQGLTLAEVSAKYQDTYAEWLKNPHLVKIPGGESLDDVRERALKVVEKALTHQNAVVLVSHRVVNKLLICALLGLDNSHFWNIKQDTGAMSSFAHENGRFVLTGHNLTPGAAQASAPDF